ncbi:LysR family transcriptional regulator [Mameliella sediminis]|uniref:LysR family transcriptional regulator n=1 Tax=Mameliella sediminis TaxID=2836866 RepID=UPI001C48A860|nr:LysR family transcriptional regulator [Mameliella sediminis]MBY6144810.1 LysR family transcriptional regulator [Mameliella alba]MBV7395925.1 LysR family transcriptional regulator [Mameliella sediminis]MBY6160337.1 LysR family transcriptional regulator [Mameliella alba]MBY6168807.1 LysR family transcriptional regulator [Mameliella alba]MBY6173972.1 LysR family transcriptional regulator [Mameliella alba]
MRHLGNLQDLSNFLSIAKAGSLTRASAEENVPKATLSTSLARLEETLNVVLAQRGKNGVKLTEAGQALLENSGLVFEACEIAANAARRAHSALEGTVRVAATYEFGASILGTTAIQIARENPGLDFDLQFFPNDVLFQRAVDFDCMVYFGQPPSSNLLTRKIGEMRYQLVCSPEFIREHGPIREVSDLEPLPGVLVTRGGMSEDWKLADSLNSQTVRFNPRFRVHDYWTAKVLAVNGVAMAYMPTFFTHYEIESGALMSLLPRYSSPPRNVYALYPSSRQRNPRIRMVVEKLQDSFESLLMHPGYQIGAPLP